jgi:hypothetical protein
MQKSSDRYEFYVGFVYLQPRCMNKSYDQDENSTAMLKTHLEYAICEAECNWGDK